MKADIDLSEVYPHPIRHVWEALTSSRALAAWLMPNDFVPEVGHRFTFRTRPAPGFDGTVRCRVLELKAPCRMVWSWEGGPIETTLTFTLTELGDRSTRLRLHQVGFHGLGGALTRRLLRSGFRDMLREGLPAWLDRPDGPPESPPRDGSAPWPRRRAESD
ncbi:SRPBCC domain-containing protein [Streptosporangium sp. NPDC004379]|uniref:SRPBCC family protein n=1 Tax=Streptosporangium sp. NPDC004379 TaxID=3366189 RepID=UPI00368FDF91